MDDVAEITALNIRYCWLIDAGALDDLVELFSPVAFCDLGHFGQLTGSAEIRSGYASLIKSIGLPGARQNSAINPVVEVDGASARGSRTSLLTTCAPMNRPSLSGRWAVTRICTRRVRADGGSPGPRYS